MMSAGLIGSPGLGYAKDRYSGEELAKNPAAYAEFKASQPSQWLVFKAVTGIDGQKLQAARSIEPGMRTPEQQAAVEADIKGNRRTLKTDSFIPGVMAVIYLLILLYFKSMAVTSQCILSQPSNKWQARRPAAAAPTVSQTVTESFKARRERRAFPRFRKIIHARSKPERTGASA